MLMLFFRSRAMPKCTSPSIVYDPTTCASSRRVILLRSMHGLEGRGAYSVWEIHTSCTTDYFPYFIAPTKSLSSLESSACTPHGLQQQHCGRRRRGHKMSGHWRRTVKSENSRYNSPGVVPCKKGYCWRQKYFSLFHYSTLSHTKEAHLHKYTRLARREWCRI